MAKHNECAHHDDSMILKVRSKAKKTFEFLNSVGLLEVIQLQDVEFRLAEWR